MPDFQILLTALALHTAEVLQGCVYPAPDKFLVDVASNGQGCTYVLHNDGSLFYHEYPELPGLLPCKVSLEEFIDTFFKEPTYMVNPFRVGWVEYEF